MPVTTPSQLTLLERCRHINQFHMPQEHAPAAVPLQAQCIQRFLGAFAFLQAFFIFFPEMGNGLAARKTAYGYDHGGVLICMIFVSSPLLWNRSACGLPFAARQQRAAIYRTRRRLFSAFCPALQEPGPWLNVLRQPARSLRPRGQTRQYPDPSHYHPRATTAR